MKRKLSVVGNTIYNTAGSCFYLICQWLLTVLVIRLGSVENGGILSLAMSVTNVFFTLSTFGIRGFQVSDWDHKYSTEVYFSTRILTCGLGFILCTGYCLTGPGHTGYETVCVIVYMLFRIGEALSDEHQAIQQTEERMDYVFRSFVIRGILLIGSFTVVMVTTHDLLKAIGAMAGATLLAVLLYELPVCRKLTGMRLRFDLKKSGKLLAENAPLMANSLLMAFLVMVPRTRLDALMGNYEMGIYGSIASPAAIMQSAALWLFMPSLTVFARYWGERRKEDFFHLHHRILLMLAGVMAVIFIGAQVMGRWGLKLLFGEEVAGYAYLLLPTLVTTALIAGEYYLSSLLTVTRSLWMIAAANAAALVLTFILSEPLIRAGGMQGVNNMLYISMGVNCLIQYIIFRRDTARHFSGESN